MGEKKARRKDYNKLANTIVEEAHKTGFEVRLLDTPVYDGVGYPFYMLRSRNPKAKYTALLMSGMHGEEWWGIDCLLHSLGALDKDAWNLYVAPCMNAYGWSFMSRLNGEKKGSNMRVGERDTKELKLLFSSIPDKLSLMLDVHGDVDRAEVYAYERRVPGVDSLATLALKDTEIYFPIYKAKKVYGEPCRGGVVSSKKEATAEEYIFENFGPSYSITVEIPGRIAGTGINRLAGGSRLIQSIFNNFERAKGMGAKVVEKIDVPKVKPIESIIEPQKEKPEESKEEPK